MTPLAIAAGAAALSSSLALLVLRVVRRIPLRYVARRERVRITVGSALSASLIALVALTLGARASLSLALAVTLPLLPAWASARLRRRERAVASLAESLPRAARPGEVRRLLVAHLAALPRDPRLPSAHASIVAGAASSLRRSGFVTDARHVVDALDLDGLSPDARSSVVFERAALALLRGELEAAEAALDSDTDAHPALRALTHAVQGGADQALSFLEHGDFRGESGLIAASARAHALASMGREGEADAGLGELVANHGMAALAWVLRPVGPATERARSRFRPPTNEHGQPTEEP